MFRQLAKERARLKDLSIAVNARNCTSNGESGRRSI